MLIIGLTGGIGSGKTTVSNLFAELDVPIIDTDKIARELAQPNQPAFIEITKTFGKGILNTKGEIDRKALRSIIFTSEESRLKLERILHPLIQREVQQTISTINSSYCIVVVPLLIESNDYKFIDRILVIDTPEDLQIQRTVTRDQVTESQVREILDAQVDRKTRLKAANDIINNDGDLDSLKKQVEELHQSYLLLAEKP